MYKASHDQAVTKHHTRNLRLAYSKAWVKLNEYNTQPFVFSLPGTSGKYEREMFNFFRGEKIDGTMIAYEKSRKRFESVKPLGALSTLGGKVRLSREMTNSIGDGNNFPVDYFWDRDSRLTFDYYNAQIDSPEKGMAKVCKETDLLNDPEPILFDGDFCGWLSQGVIDCLKHCVEGSLVTLTFYCLYRGTHKLDKWVPIPKNATHVSAHDMAEIQRKSVEAYFTGNKIPFTRLVHYEYTNNKSPMVLFVYHLRKDSPLKTLKVDREKTHDAQIQFKKDLYDRRNKARVLIKAGKLSTVEIDKLLNLPPYTSAGFVASAKRYGMHILDKVES